MKEFKSTGNYHNDIKIYNSLKLRELEDKLPDFCTQFFRGINDRVSTRTQIGYAYDLAVFFRYIAGDEDKIKVDNFGMVSGLFIITIDDVKVKVLKQ